MLDYVRSRNEDFFNVATKLVESITKHGLDRKKFDAECSVCRVEAHTTNYTGISSDNIFRNDQVLVGPKAGIPATDLEFRNIEAFYKKFYFPGNSSIILSMPLDDDGEIDEEIVEEIIDRMIGFTFYSKLKAPVNRHQELHTDNTINDKIGDLIKIIDKCENPSDTFYNSVIRMSLVVPPYYDKPRLEPLPKDVLDKGVIWSNLKYRYNMTMYGHIARFMLFRVTGIVSNITRAAGDTYTINLRCGNVGRLPTETIAYTELSFTSRADKIQHISSTVHKVIDSIINDGKYIDEFATARRSAEMWINISKSKELDLLKMSRLMGLFLNDDGVNDVVSNMILTEDGHAEAIANDEDLWTDFREFLKLLKITNSSSFESTLV